MRTPWPPLGTWKSWNPYLLYAVLGEFELQLHQPARALGPLQSAKRLDLGSVEIGQALAEEQAQATASGSRSTKNSGSGP